MKRTILVLSLLFSFTDKKCFAQDISQQISLRDKEINAYYVRASHGFWATGGGRHLCELWTNVYVNNRLLNRTSGENNFNKTAYDFYKEKPINIRYTGKAQREIDYIFYTTCGGDEEGIERTDPIELCKRLYYHVNGDNHGTSLTYSLEAYAIPLHTLSSE
ncbi:hypothetical protein, partial [Capnocytophaga cynodegmi]|uniref:hypothetical protein n=1 Tax=Capnocytophaga cynodegmi TaxID=28189 RepID=UPI001BB399A3